jgi:uncharacterized protein YjiS (DUF1127 family)
MTQMQPRKGMNKEIVKMTASTRISAGLAAGAFAGGGVPGSLAAGEVAIAVLRRAWRALGSAWRDARAADDLRALNDRMLRDIGIDRHDLRDWSGRL